MSVFNQMTRLGSVLLLSLYASGALAQGVVSTMKEALPDNRIGPLEEVDTLALTGRTSSLEFNVGLLGLSKEDVYLNSKYAAATVGISGETKFNSYLSARLATTFYMAAGDSSNRYANEGSKEGPAPTFFGLDEAALKFEPFEVLALQAGVLPTEFSSFPTTFDTASFPGLKESLNLKGDYLHAVFFAMQAIPTADGPSVKATESGITTTFNAYGTEIKTNPDDMDALTLKASALHFQFNNLTTSAATDSKEKGNTVLPTEQARFMYGFVGNEFGIGGSIRFSRATKLTLGGTFLRNNEAPEGSNKGYIYSAALKTRVFKGDLTTTLGYFYNESDTLPASYIAPARGGTNRFGQFVNITHNLVKDKIKSFVKYIRANEIEDRPKTADREQVSLGLEVSYEII